MRPVPLYAEDEVRSRRYVLFVRAVSNGCRLPEISTLASAAVPWIRAEARAGRAKIIPDPFHGTLRDFRGFFQFMKGRDRDHCPGRAAAAVWNSPSTRGSNHADEDSCRRCHRNIFRLTDSRASGLEQEHAFPAYDRLGFLDSLWGRGCLGRSSSASAALRTPL